MMRPGLTHLLACLLLLPTVARAAPRSGFAVAPGALDRALMALAQQAGIDIGSAEPGLGQVRVGGVSGRMDASAALRALLDGTPYRAVAVSPGRYRIVRRPAEAPPTRAPPHRPAPPAPARPATGEIVITAGKRNAPLLRFPGSVTVLPGDDAALGANAAASVADLSAGIPIVQTTALGVGRDKLFVRGIADSSLLGATQSTASVYFGDVPLGYSGPDPSLNLFDVDTVEILEGPQGTLYGSGAIGGIVRLSPRAPDLARVGAAVAAGATATGGGGPGYDLAAMLNLPVIGDRLGLRAVAYRTREGGYIDDVRRGLSDINGSVTSGGRLGVRAVPGNGWTIDAGIVGQTIATADSQYAERGVAGLARATAIAQPFEQYFLLGRLIVTKRWDSGLQLVSATGGVVHHVDDRFDASRAGSTGAPVAYDTHNVNDLFTQELRLSRSTARGGGWLVGLRALHDLDIYTRTLGPLGAERDIVGVTNRTLDLALFGEVTVPLSAAVLVTGGARVTRSRTDGEPTSSRRVNDFLNGHRFTRVDPTAALSWLVAPGVAVFARYQSGFRTGGIAVAAGIGRVAEYRADTIHVAELGIRHERRGALGLAGSASVSYALWNNIQADLVDVRGFPYSTNIGDGRVRGFEATGSWIPVRGLRAAVALFFADSRLTDPVARLANSQDSRLPDTPRVSASGDLSYRWAAARGSLFSAVVGWRYVGESMLGTQAPLDIAQGGYTVGTVTLGWERGRLGLTATIDNIADNRGNRFALGDPFKLLARDEYTPPRPRSIRLGAAMRW